MNQQELVVQAPQPIERPAPLGVAGMLERFINKGVTAENVAAFEGLVRLHREQQAWEAEREFNAAFVKLQQEVPKVKADRIVPDGKGGALYQYCSYEEIHAQAQPIMTANGFSARFTQKMEPDGVRVTVTCFLMHRGGHTVTNDYTVRSGRGAPGMNETKCDTSAGTIAQREAFCDALNIVRRGGDDPRNEGGPITAEQAADLRDRVQKTGSDEKAFLKFAQAANYESILSGKYAILDASLRRKESTRG